MVRKFGVYKSQYTNYVVLYTDSAALFYTLISEHNTREEAEAVALALNELTQ